MILFTKEIEKQLQSQYKFGSDLDKQVVVAKIFNPYGKGYWYILNQDPDNTDYLWAIVDWAELDMGSVSKSELESIEVPPFNLPLERDRFFKQINAKELWEGIVNGKHYAKGGPVCEKPLSAKESAKLNQKLTVSEHSKQKNEKVKNWIQTGRIDNDEIHSIIKAAKLLGVSVSEINHIKTNLIVNV